MKLLQVFGGMKSLTILGSTIKDFSNLINMKTGYKKKVLISTNECKLKVKTWHKMKKNVATTY